MSIFTDEQNKIFEKVMDPRIKLLKVNSVAGSGKTTILVQISKMLNPKNGLYLAYNKAIATEASEKFSGGTYCSTTHSLAYQNTVKIFNLNVGFFNYKSITDPVAYEHKVLVIEMLREFSLSNHVKFDSFVIEKSEQYENIPKKVYDLVKKYFMKMTAGEIPITHDAYLKFYHLLLHNEKIKHKVFDLVMLDEAGDLNPVTLEIFRLLPAHKKIMVGDENQNIYTFNNTINGFVELHNIGDQLNMTQSFRCDKDIAAAIEYFCKTHLNPEMRFVGVKHNNYDIKTRAFISRNNSTLVGKMIELNKQGIKYNLTRPVKSIFELLLILLTLKPGGKIYSAEWKHMQDDVDDWGSTDYLQLEYPTALKYIASLYGSEQAVSSALGVIGKYSPSNIFAAYENAKAHENEKGHSYTLCTAHSSKGLEFDEVTLGDDLNESVTKIVTEKIRDDYNSKDLETMRLYYVACSRAVRSLLGADHLTLLHLGEPGVY